jgi:hypothetical protein
MGSPQVFEVNVNFFWVEGCPVEAQWIPAAVNFSFMDRILPSAGIVDSRNFFGK